MVTAQSKENFAVEVSVRHHKIIEGLAANIGGDDSGPNPHEMLEAALAGCTIQTCHLYANRKEWPLKSTEVTVEIISENKVQTVISRKIKFFGELAQDQRARLLEIADKCPIHRLLSGAVEIKTEVLDHQ